MALFTPAMEIVHENEGSALVMDNNSALAKYGINAKANPDIDVANLTKAQAEQIYYDRYWKPSNASAIKDQDLTNLYFDMVVQSGLVGAGKILQKTLNKIGANLKVDGIVGPLTIAAINNVEPRTFQQALILARWAFWLELADAKGYQAWTAGVKKRYSRWGDLDTPLTTRDKAAIGMIPLALAIGAFLLFRK